MKRRMALLLAIGMLVSALVPMAYAESDVAAPAAEKLPEVIGDPMLRGNIVTFGRYEQDDDPHRNPEPLEWIVVDYDHARGSALLLSRYVLDARAYQAGGGYPTWENSDIRQWLNDDFLDTAFSQSEQNALVETYVKTTETFSWLPADKRQSRGFYENISGGNETWDRVFLLSVEEAMALAGAESYAKAADVSKDQPALKAPATKYALAQGVGADADGYCRWWLRSPAADGGYASDVSGGGHLDAERVGLATDGIRPAIRLKLDEVRVTGSPTRKGSVITFGSYSAGADPDTAEPLEWLVLEYDAENRRALLLSRSILDARRFHASAPYPSWAKSELRKWLNTEFPLLAFGDEEREALLPVNVHTDTHDTNAGGPDSEDRVWLLSRDEAMLWLGENENLIAYPTAGAIRQGVHQAKGKEGAAGSAWWWLRSPAGEKGRASAVTADGNLHEYNVLLEAGGVRPAMWVNVDASCFAGRFAAKAASAPSEGPVLTGDPTAVGSEVTFGRYEQDADGNNGPEPIVWRVLRYDSAGRRALLLSKYVLDGHSLHSLPFFPTWERCGGRRWLNAGFLNTAFTDKEQSVIRETAIHTPDSTAGIPGGEDTTDKIWLLSEEEIRQYLPEAKDRLAVPTAYAEKRGVQTYSEYCFWWTRSPGGKEKSSLRVNVKGDFFEGVYATIEPNIGVRPALWLDLDALEKLTAEAGK